MSKPSTCPRIVHDVPSYAIIQGSTFNIPIIELFEPKDGSLRFYLKPTPISWLNLDHYRGVLYGIAPQVPYSKSFHITLTVSNEMGHVIKELILKVIDTDVVETMPHTLQHILSLRKQDYGYSHLLSYVRELSEYIYAFYSQETYQAAFEKSIRDAAELKNIKLAKDKISYHDFKSVMNAINPEFEKILRENFGVENALTKVALNNHDLRNLFRQGSQPTGTIAIPVWNHFGSPDLYNWSDHNPISNVLDAASESIQKREVQENILQNQLHHKRT